MVAVNTGKNKIRDLINSNINSGKVGTDGTDAGVGDTNLGSEVSGVDKSITVSTSNKTLNIQYEIFSTEANSNTLKEGAVFFSDDVLLDRFVFPDYDKTASNALVLIDIFKIL